MAKKNKNFVEKAVVIENEPIIIDPVLIIPSKKPEESKNISYGMRTQMNTITGDGIKQFNKIEKKTARTIESLSMEELRNYRRTGMMPK